MYIQNINRFLYTKLREKIILIYILSSFYSKTGANMIEDFKPNLKFPAMNAQNRKKQEYITQPDQITIPKIILHGW